MQTKAMLCGAAVAFALVAAQCTAHAEVVDQQANGFSISEAATIAASPDKVYTALTDIGHWWSSGHTFSRDAKNMHMDARAGGCWCETLPDGGSVLHMTVVYAAPGKLLRLRGALGPFQATGMEGVLTFALKPNGSSTDVTVTSDIGGYMKGGLGPLPKAADGVIGEQVQRLKSFIETGSPEPKH